MDRKERIRKLREMSVMDENSGKPMCMLCQATFANTYTVVRHIEATHVQVRSYQCDFCDRSFKTVSQRTDHCSKIHREQYQMKKNFLATPAGTLFDS